MNKQALLKTCRSRKGIVIFVVLGGIFVLGIMIFAYNYLVRGKFHETRDLLTHLKAFKIVQSVNRYIVARMFSDCRDKQSGLKQKFLQTNDPDNLKKEVQDWLLSIQGDIDKLVHEMAAPIKKSDIEVITSMTFSDIQCFSGDPIAGVHYLDCEKSGILKLISMVKLGKTREILEETRPFKVVCTVPIPMGKFSLYVSKANPLNDDFKFNTIDLDLNGKPVQNSPKPLIFFHGSPGIDANRNPDIWKKRGWVYLGGKNVILNRGGGVGNFGQRFHSYFPTGNMPIALRLNFDNFQSISAAGKTFVLKSARWGFFNTLLGAGSSQIWKKILKDDFVKYPETNAPLWKSSCLHLFGLGQSQNTMENLRSITRVCGNVYDRFIDMTYLVTDPPEVGPLAGIISLSSGDYSKASGKSGLLKSVSLDDLIEVVPVVKQRLNIANLDFLKDFFKDLPFALMNNNYTSLCYQNIMSRTSFCGYDETFKQIAQYELNNQNLDIPPTGDIPKNDDFTSFFPKFIDGSEFTGKLNEAENVSDAGMSKRICFEITPQNVPAKDKNGPLSGVVKTFESIFILPDNTNTLDLRDSVVRLSMPPGTEFSLRNNLSIFSGGALLTNASIHVGTFRNIQHQPDSTLCLISEDKRIIVDNRGQSPTRAFLIALGAEGKLETLEKLRPLSVFGAIAVRDLDPSQIAGGGEVWYDENLDPTNDRFFQKFSVVIGPRGAE